MNVPQTSELVVVIGLLAVIHYAAGTTMMTKTSRLFRNFGLLLIAIAAADMFVFFILKVQFNISDTIGVRMALVWTICFWAGLISYFVGRFQYRP